MASLETLLTNSIYFSYFPLALGIFTRKVKKKYKKYKKDRKSILSFAKICKKKSKNRNTDWDPRILIDQIFKAFKLS